MENKKWYMSRTLWLAVIQGVAGIVAVLSTEFPAVGWVAIVKSVVDIALRFVTNKPIFGSIK